jgi:hypothetical protein
VSAFIAVPPDGVGPPLELAPCGSPRVSDTDAVAVTGRDGSLLGLITAKDVLAAVAGAKRCGPRPPEEGRDAPTLFRLVRADIPNRVAEDTAEGAVTSSQAT